jgi:hypothetical protein
MVCVFLILTHKLLGKKIEVPFLSFGGSVLQKISPFGCSSCWAQKSNVYEQDCSQPNALYTTTEIYNDAKFHLLGAMRISVCFWEKTCEL